MASKFDPRKITSLHDLNLAKERYRYEILVREQALFSSTGSLQKAVKATVNTTLNHLAQILVATAVRRLFRSKSG